VVGRGKKILLVEDEAIIAMDISVRLRRLGYLVPAHASTAQEAVDLDRAENPDFILMDIRLAGELDGIDAARHILARRKVPIAFMTGYTNEETLLRCSALTPIACLPKPVNMGQVQGAIELALERL